MTETAFGALAAGFLGLMLGSFLNVCAYRWPNDLSVVSPRSQCPTCDRQIRWYDNIPVLSWLALRGKCRDCRAPISIQYPMVELATGLIWAGTFWYAGPTWEAGRGAFFLSVLFGIALTDARYYIIPDEFSLGGMLVGLAASVIPGGIEVTAAFLGAAVGFGVLWSVGWLGKLAFKKDAMGFGDVKMMAMIGAFLGPVGVLLTIFLGALFGSVIFGPISWKTGKLVPFGLFLAAGAAVSYGWGEAIITWYRTQMLGL